MASLRLSLSLLLFSIFCISRLVEPAPAVRSRSRSESRAHIEASCRATRYPALCVQLLSGFPSSTIQNPQQLAQAALSASLYRARHTRSYMLKVANELEAMKAKDYQAVKDCLDQINDTVEQLSQSIRELRRLGSQEEAVGRGNVFWHISNVETWTSAALSDVSYCVNEFPGRRMSKLKATIKGKVLNVAQATSNALALFHRYAARYKAGATTQKP
ncbi:21 kDa protein [Ricinus communis]|uniref:21 kDa protein, putative n=1 Tax=Ricinus communis TaxID=3988 RepID=B9RD94_RICCO|nr:21 kDa protein [Ricinus communis]EEF50352.1 21 kDa protein precursor, putative [Ricinus communis]|eukprot:XP_002511683.1 21 kDa protein [Ricinus communis]